MPEAAASRSPLRRLRKALSRSNIAGLANDNSSSGSRRPRSYDDDQPPADLTIPCSRTSRKSFDLTLSRSHTLCSLSPSTTPADSLSLSGVSTMSSCPTTRARSPDDSTNSLTPATPQSAAYVTLPSPTHSSFSGSVKMLPVTPASPELLKSSIEAQVLTSVNQAIAQHGTSQLAMTAAANQTMLAQSIHAKRVSVSAPTSPVTMIRTFSSSLQSRRRGASTLFRNAPAAAALPADAHRYAALPLPSIPQGKATGTVTAAELTMSYLPAGLYESLVQRPQTC
ncbi:hypothetical protein PYCC9005_005283 [Savitreella phatthalungensis]